MTKRKGHRKEREGFNIWRSYSDMMAGLLLLFVLIMCVTLFQAQKNYVEKLAEQEERIRLQDEYKTAMLEKQEELEAQDKLLSQQKEKLEEQNLTLDEMQAVLEEQARLLDEKQSTLEQQQITLENQQATLKEQQGELDQLQITLSEQEKEISSKTAELKKKQDQIDRIIGVKAEVIEALRREFAANDVNVKIDEQTGALMLDSNVLFAYDDVELSGEGQDILRQVLPIYCSVLLSDQYRPNVAELLIDGYTDTDGSYEYNLQLSQQRSLAVADFLLGIEGEFLDEADSATLRDILTVNGHSYSNPILDAAGTVDMEASRRVEVKFRLKDEEMIQELRTLLD